MENGRAARPYPRSVRLLGEGLSLTEEQHAELSDLARGRPGNARTTGRMVVPSQLPAGVPQFVGRQRELKALDELLGKTGPAPADSAVVISAIAGTAGIGKTALAVHWARRAAANFPDGQLYVNLRGFGPSGEPVSPAEAVTGFLTALGVPSEQLPPGFDAQVGLYRSVAAGKRLLMVLDNARDDEQVRPLLPGSPGCLVLLTSRASLAGLAVTEGAHLLTLDVLPEDEARRLLERRLGSARVAAEPGAAAELILMCARLPLALTIVTARASACPGLALADLAAELREESGRLDALDTGDPASSMRAVISWSYRSLTEQGARMFRVLGLHPGPDVSAPAAASAAAVALPAARRCLRELTRGSLLAEHRAGRFGFHDLLRAYAADQARFTDSEPANSEAIGRILDHYLHTAADAAVLINPARDRITVPAARPGVAPECLADQQQALGWLQAEHQVLLATTALAYRTGFDIHAWQIPWTMAQYLDVRGWWRDMATAQGTAIAAATRLSDTAAQAESLRVLAQACARLGDHGEALAHYTASLTLYQQLGDRPGEAKSRQYLGLLAGSQGRYADALNHGEQALRLYRATSNRVAEAGVLNNVGYTRILLGDYEQARVICQQALSLHADLGLRYGEAHAWDSLGCAEQHLGHLAEAVTCYQRACNIFREFGDHYLEATILTHLGDARQASGQQQLAREAWQQALVLLDELGHPDADEVRGKLGSVAAIGRRPEAVMARGQPAASHHHQNHPGGGSG